MVEYYLLSTAICNQHNIHRHTYTHTYIKIHYPAQRNKTTMEKDRNIEWTFYENLHYNFIFLCLCILLLLHNKQNKKQQSFSFSSYWYISIYTYTFIKEQSVFLATKQKIEMNEYTTDLTNESHEKEFENWIIFKNKLKMHGKKRKDFSVLYSSNFTLNKMKNYIQIKR